MIKINEQRIIQNDTLVENLTKIMDRQDAEILVDQLEDYQKFQEEMQKQIKSPDKIQLEFEKRTDKEVFLDKFKRLHFDCNYSLQESIEEANTNINLSEEEIKEVLEIIVNAAV